MNHEIDEMQKRFVNEFGELTGLFDIISLYRMYHFYCLEKIKTSNNLLDLRLSLMMENVVNQANKCFKMSKVDFINRFHKWNIINNPGEYSEKQIKQLSK
jgi:hypothetical protein